jgi:hypothetical protein
MMAISLRARFSFRDALRLLGVAAALLTLSTVASQRAEALSPVNPGMAGTSKTIANGQTIEVRGGHGGGSGGHGSGSVGGGRGFGGAVVGGGVYYGDYPYDDSDYYDYPPVYPAFVAGGGCRRVMTVHGPRVVCHHRAARHHRVHRRHHHRSHHHA